MVTRLCLGLTLSAALLGACGLEEPPPQYAHQCYRTPACASRPDVVVNIRTPPPAPSRPARTQCPAGTFWRPGRPLWNGYRWVPGRGRCAPVPVAYRQRPGCVYLRGRWVRTWQGWRAVRGRWICRR